MRFRFDPRTLTQPLQTFDIFDKARAVTGQCPPTSHKSRYCSHKARLSEATAERSRRVNTSMKRGCIGILILGVAVLLLPNCTAHRKPSSVEKALANAAKDVVIPLEAENLKNPLDSSPETIQKGSAAGRGRSDSRLSLRLSAA